MKRARWTVLALILAACGSPTEPEVRDDDPEPTAPVITSVTLSSPRGDLLAVGTTVDVAADVRNDTGATVSGASLTWESEDPLVASVTSGGVVRGEGQGSTRVSAIAEGGVRGTIELRVANADVGRMMALLDDSFLDELIAALGGTDGAAVGASFEACDSAMDAGNLAMVLTCIGSARDDLEAGSEPSGGPVRALLGLFVDWLERYLNYPVLMAERA